MITIIYRRNKCIGCNYCTEIAPQRWQMNQKDGKSNLIGSKEKKGFWTNKVPETEFEMNQKSAYSCPVKVIEILKI